MSNGVSTALAISSVATFSLGVATLNVYACSSGLALAGVESFYTKRTNAIFSNALATIIFGGFSGTAAYVTGKISEWLEINPELKGTAQIVTGVFTFMWSTG